MRNHMSPAQRERLEAAVRRETAFRSFADMLESMMKDRYVPTLRGSKTNLIKRELDRLGLAHWPDGMEAGSIHDH